MSEPDLRRLVESMALTIHDHNLAIDRLADRVNDLEDRLSGLMDLIINHRHDS